jgi:Sulfotransferase family
MTLQVVNDFYANYQTVTFLFKMRGWKSFAGSDATRMENSSCNKSSSSLTFPSIVTDSNNQLLQLSEKENVASLFQVCMTTKSYQEKGSGIRIWVTLFIFLAIVALFRSILSETLVPIMISSGISFMQNLNNQHGETKRVGGVLSSKGVFNDRIHSNEGLRYSSIVQSESSMFFSLQGDLNEEELGRSGDISDNSLSENEIRQTASNHVDLYPNTKSKDHKSSRENYIRRRLQNTKVSAVYESMNENELRAYVSEHPLYQRLVGVEEDLPFDPATQIPFFFHIHKSGGSSMKHIFMCLGLTQTRRGNVNGCSDQADHLEVCSSQWGKSVNADASSPEGIERIQKLGLLDMNIPNLVVTSSRFYEALSIFSPNRRGRLFLLLRDPVERAVSKYYYSRIATWERNYNPLIANMTMLEYANSRYYFDNWVTRRLIHKMNPLESITDADLRLAKEIVKQKAFILLTELFEPSIYRMFQYFGWGLTAKNHWCGIKYAKVDPINQNPHPVPEIRSPEWLAFRYRNFIDFQLYQYTADLYHFQQTQFLSSKYGPLILPPAIDAGCSTENGCKEVDDQS